MHCFRPGVAAVLLQWQPPSPKLRCCRRSTRVATKGLRCCRRCWCHEQIWPLPVLPTSRCPRFAERKASLATQRRKLAPGPRHWVKVMCARCYQMIQSELPTLVWCAKDADSMATNALKPTERSAQQVRSQNRSPAALDGS